MQILLPIGGIGKRFSGFDKPKPLIDVLGKPVILWLLDNLSKTANVHIACNAILESLPSIVKEKYPDITFYDIGFQTRGAAETVLCALNGFTQEQLDDTLLVLDADNIYKDDVIARAKGNCIFYFEDDGDPIYSYITISMGKVNGIAEKRKISNHANAGVYGFSSGRLAKAVIEAVISGNDKTNSEFYLSGVFGRLLENKTEVNAIPIGEYYQLGTPELLRQTTYKLAEIYNVPVAARQHNTIEYTDTTVIKRGDVEGLVYYYANIIYLPEVEHFHPKVTHFYPSKTLIETERIHGVTYSQLYVNNCFMFSYMDKLLDYFSAIHAIKPVSDQPDIYANWYQKTMNRLAQYKLDVKNWDAVTLQVLDFLHGYEQESRGQAGMIHGDPVFTNIILDNDNHIKLIDMRGKLGDVFSIYGDIFYDYAKVWQSLIGYDEVLLGKECNAHYKEEMKSYFRMKFEALYGKEKFEEVRWLTKSLLLSLLPVHNDEKCVKYFELIEQC